MRKKILLSIAAIAVALCIGSGCSRAAQEAAPAKTTAVDAAPSNGAVTLTPEELEAITKQAVDEALAARDEAAAPPPEETPALETADAAQTDALPDAAAQETADSSAQEAAMREAEQIAAEEHAARETAMREAERLAAEKAEADRKAALAKARTRYVEGSGAKPAIGNTGPGGGVIFAVNGYAYMEVSEPLGKVSKDGDAYKKGKEYRGGGLSDWTIPSTEALLAIYKNLVRTGKADFGNDYFRSSWGLFQYNVINDWDRQANAAPDNTIPGFPGYAMYLAGGGMATPLIRLKDGRLDYDKLSGTLCNTVAVRYGYGGAKMPAKGGTGVGGGTIFATGKYGRNGAYIEYAVAGEAASEAEALALAKAYRGGGFSDWIMPDYFDDNGYAVTLANYYAEASPAEQAILSVPFWVTDVWDDMSAVKDLTEDRGQNITPNEGTAYPVLVLRYSLLP
jgi:hypothetical protein